MRLHCEKTRKEKTYFVLIFVQQVDYKNVPLQSMTKNPDIKNSECIQCGACIDNCPKTILSYGMIEREENDNGK